MSEYALRLANGADTAPRVRMGDTLHVRQAGALTGRSGLRRDGGGSVSVVAGTMQVQVTPFLAWVDGGSATAQAGYAFILDTTKSLTLSDGHATLSRTDTIAVVIHEDTYDSSGLTDAAVVVVEGTPGAGAPTLPATCLPLRDVTVPATLSAGSGGLSSGNLGTDRRVWTVGAGGLLPVASETERDALSNVQKGDAVYRDDTKCIETYNGTSWDTYLNSTKLKVGTASLVFNGSGECTLTHNLGVVPTFLAAHHDATGAVIALTVKSGSPTSTTCVLRAWKDDGTAHTGTLSVVRWLAIA